MGAILSGVVEFAAAHERRRAGLAVGPAWTGS
jgi:hypothetical protein